MKKNYLLISSVTVLFALLYITLQLPLRELNNQQSKYSKKEKYKNTRKIESARKKWKRENRFVNSGMPDEFQKYYHLIKTRVGEKEPRYPIGYRMKELHKALKRRGLSKKRGEKLDWICRGPGNLGGRTRAIIVDPDDENHNTWYAGAVSGGIWKTTDAGTTWTNLTPEILPNIGITAMAMAESNHDVIYAGTGETYSVQGDGIFKTTDRGQTWQHLENTAANRDFLYVYRLIVDPDDENMVIAATGRGIFKTTDGGENWTKVYNSQYSYVECIVADPSNFSIQYAGINGEGVYKSTDAGDTWTKSSSGLSFGLRHELAVSPSNPDKVYVSVEVEGESVNHENGLYYLYSSDDKGETWRQYVDKDDANRCFLGTQGDYNNTIAVHPFDENVVYVGGVYLGKIRLSQIFDESEPRVVSVDSVNTGNFFDFQPFIGGKFFGGGMNTGDEEEATNLETNDWVSVEIRFGPGKKQKAHRFTVPSNSGTNNDGGAGVPAEDYEYQDYVDVPFEVWDVTNNQQLMVSFRDQERDGKYNLIHRDPDNEVAGREYMFVNSVPYDANTPDPNIAKNGGRSYKLIYFIWPRLMENSTWDETDLPDSKLFIEYGKLKLQKGEETVLSDVYGRINNDTPKNENLHVDHHALIMIPIDQGTGKFRIVNGNDGGLGMSDDGGISWKQISDGYITTQFYDVSKHPTANEYIGGMQDHGTFTSPIGKEAVATSNYFEEIGGDGFENVWHLTNPDKIIGCSQFNQFKRTTDGGKTWNWALAGINADQAPFYTKVTSMYTNPDVLFAVSTKGVLKSEDFGLLWKLIPISDDDGWGLAGADKTVTSAHNIRVSKANDQVVWTGAGMISGEDGYIRANPFVSTDGGTSFKPVNNYADMQINSFCSGLATHPYKDKVAYMLFSAYGQPKILRTKDLGETWEDISGFGENEESSNGFPNTGVNHLLVMPHNPNIIWAGTEIGIFESTDNGKTWAYADNGLPAVSINQMKIYGDQIVVATYGRGIWTVTMPELLNEPPEDYLIPPKIVELSQNFSGNYTIDYSLQSKFDSTRIVVNDVVYKTIEANTEKTTQKQIIDSEQESITVKIVCYKNEEELSSVESSYTKFPVLQAQNTYFNDFNTTTEHFTGNGFSITQAPDFNDPAIHSEHPYELGNEYIFTLKVPIIVANTPAEASIIYNEVAIIEKGDPGTVYGQEEFWDYVIVEATNDFKTWKPLIDGYDANWNKRWSLAYDGNLSGTRLHLNKHEVGLGYQFDPGDTVLIRFRLFSDAAANGWGWCIDDLSIQNEILHIKPIPYETLSFNIFPNPTNGEVNFMMNNNFAGRMQLEIFDINGKSIFQRELRKATTHYQKKIDLTNKKSGIYILKLYDGKRIATKKIKIE